MSTVSGAPKGVNAPDSAGAAAAAAAAVDAGVFTPFVFGEGSPEGSPGARMPASQLGMNVPLHRSELFNFS